MKYFLIFTLTLILTSCVNNKDELPEPGTTTAPVFTGPAISYTNHTKKYFDNYCIACHAISSTQSCCPLETYSDVDKYTSPSAVKGDMLRIKVLNFGTMPPAASASGFLTVAEKDTLQWWLDQGAPQ